MTQEEITWLGFFMICYTAAILVGVAFACQY